MLTKNTILFALLVFVPISIAAHFLEWGASVVFITSGLAIVPLAAFMGTATEEIAVVVGPSLGGLLNATFGNATELIIALIALNAGLVNVVKATITGSIISNLLLVMGFAMLLGGLRYKEQDFQPVIARVNASSMNLAVIAILVPTAVDATSAGIGEATVAETFGCCCDRVNSGLWFDAAIFYENAQLSLRRWCRRNGWRGVKRSERRS
jgi:Ca2+:H+ antiporter